MRALFVEKRRALAELCVRYHVQRLELFGSAARDDFDVQSSDLDFLVEFAPLQEGQFARAYFGLLAALEDLFARPIDLVMLSAVKNPYFLAEIASARTVLYAAA